MIRFFDLSISFVLLVIIFPVMLLIFLICFFDTGSPLFLQDRVGENLKIFKLLKFRTMQLNTDSVASHLADPNKITKVGRYLRKYKLDELPQLINVLNGDMSLVGPRPNLPNQYELIEERKKILVYNVLPGITGLAQVSGVDMSTPSDLAKKDLEGISNMSLHKYFCIIWKTISGKGIGDSLK